MPKPPDDIPNGEFDLGSRRTRKETPAGKTPKHLPFVAVYCAACGKRRGAKSFRSRRQVCHSCEVPGDS